SYVAWPLWMLGFPDQALIRSRQAITLAQELSHSFSLAAALGYAAIVHVFRREGQAAQERADATLALSREQGFPQLVTLGMAYRGWALAAQDQGEEGITAMQQAKADRQAMGAMIGWPWFLALLAEACGRAGQTEAGLALLAEALTAVHSTGECW